MGMRVVLFWEGEVLSLQIRTKWIYDAFNRYKGYAFNERYQSSQSVPKLGVFVWEGVPKPVKIKWDHWEYVEYLEPRFEYGENDWREPTDEEWADILKT